MGIIMSMMILCIRHTKTWVHIIHRCVLYMAKPEKFVVFVLDHIHRHPGPRVGHPYLKALLLCTGFPHHLKTVQIFIMVKEHASGILMGVSLTLYIAILNYIDLSNP